MRTIVASLELAQTAEERVFVVSSTQYLTIRWELSPLDEERKLMTLLGDGDNITCDVFLRGELSEL